MIKYSNKIPEDWQEYSPMGTVIEGTRIIPFKTPLRSQVCQKLDSQTERWTISDLVSRVPNLSAVIDLTTMVPQNRYDIKEFINAGIAYTKINILGSGSLPNQYQIRKFFDAMDYYMRRNRHGFVGVHCTHGLNRTGLMICKYMIERLRIPHVETIERFERARGHKIERNNYIIELLKGCPVKIAEQFKLRRGIINGINNGINNGISNGINNGFNNGIKSDKRQKKRYKTFVDRHSEKKEHLKNSQRSEPSQYEQNCDKNVDERELRNKRFRSSKNQVEYFKNSKQHHIEQPKNKASQLSKSNCNGNPVNYAGLSKRYQDQQKPSVQTQLPSCSKFDKFGNQLNQTSQGFDPWNNRNPVQTRQNSINNLNRNNNVSTAGINSYDPLKKQFQTNSFNSYVPPHRQYKNRFVDGKLKSCFRNMNVTS